MAYKPGKAWPEIAKMLAGQPYEPKTWLPFANPATRGLSPNMRVTGWVGEVGHQTGAERERYVKLLEDHFESQLPPRGTLDGGEFGGYQPLHIGANLAAIAIARFTGARRLLDLATRLWRARLALWSLAAAPVRGTWLPILPGVRTGKPGSGGKMLPEGYLTVSPVVARAFQLSFRLPLAQFAGSGGWKDLRGEEDQTFGLDMRRLAMDVLASGATKPGDHGFRAVALENASDLRTRWPVVIVRGDGWVASWFHGRVSGYHDNPRLAAISDHGRVYGLRARGIAKQNFQAWGGWCEATFAEVGLRYEFFVKQAPKGQALLQGGFWLLPWLLPGPPIHSIILTGPDRPPQLLGSLSELAGSAPPSQPTGHQPAPPDASPPPPEAGPQGPEDAEREALAREMEGPPSWSDRYRDGKITLDNMRGRLEQAAKKGR